MLPAWSELPVVVAGCGPSFDADQSDAISRAARAARCRVIAVNNAYQVLMPIDILLAADAGWWTLHLVDVNTMHPRVERVSADLKAQEYGCQWLPTAAGRGLAPSGAPYVMRGTSSGYQAAGLAIQRGARRLILVGMDCCASDDGELHWHEAHPGPLNRLPPFELWRDEWESLLEPATARGIELVNCSGRTSIRTLRRSTLAAELA
jgi:hypothetical protein